MSLDSEAKGRREESRPRAAPVGGDRRKFFPLFRIFCMVLNDQAKVRVEKVKGQVSVVSGLLPGGGGDFGPQLFPLPSFQAHTVVAQPILVLLWLLASSVTSAREGRGPKVWTEAILLILQP